MKHVKIVLATLAAVAGLLAAAAPGASARTLDEAKAACPDGELCLWENVDWEGRMASFARAVDDLGVFNGGYLNDKVSSFLNENGSVWCLGTDRASFNGGGPFFTVPAYGTGAYARANLREEPAFNDVASSARRTVPGFAC